MSVYRQGMIEIRGIAGAAALAVLLATGPVLAQGAPGGSTSGQPALSGTDAPGAGNAPATPEAETRIPAAVLSGLLTGTPEAMLALRQYLAAVGAKPEEITKRATQVVRQLKDSGLVSDPGLIMAAAERVSGAVRETLRAAKIMQLKVDKDFRPTSGTIALDFGPPDAELVEGFQRVLPNDPRVKGSAKQGVRRPADANSVLSHGIVGVEEIDLDLPDGEYRVTFLTEALGDAATSMSPFGQSINANGNSFDVLQATPQHWLNQAVMSNRGMAGFQGATNQNGGALSLTVRVIGGKLRLSLKQDVDKALKTYLTGLLVEPVESQSQLTRTPEAEDVFTPPETRLREEAEVASSIANLLEKISPEAGPVNEVPEPVVEPTQFASAS